MGDHLLVGILSAANVFQFLFWSWQLQTLVNKLMSRNFQEYQLIKEGPPPPRPTPVDFEAVVEQEEILSELNGKLRGA